jgi:Protein of unknown function (DUF3140)
MADIDTLELDALWDEFHRVVNMTSLELSQWLQLRDQGENSEESPEQPATPTGQQVLSILRKRRTDLSDDDVRVMYEVVDMVERERTTAPKPQADQGKRRHRLMTIGHDPLKSAT